MLTKISVFKGTESAVEYGYVVGVKSRIDEKNTSLDKIEIGTPGTMKVDCTKTGKLDHKNFKDYRIFSLVINYSNDSEKEQNLVARPYITYTDAQGVTRTFFGEYTGTNVYGGCCSNYNDAKKAISDLDNGLQSN